MDVALEHDAVVVVHVVDDGEVQPHVLPVQQPGHALQLVQRRLRKPRGAVGAQGRDHVRGSAVGADERRHAVKVPARAQLFKPVQVLLPDARKRHGPPVGLQLQPVHQRRNHAHVGQLQHVVRVDHLQALRGQRQHLAQAVAVHVADALQARLHDLLELPRGPGDAVHVLRIAHLLNVALHVPRVLDDRQRHIGLQGHQPPVRVREGDDSLGHQKVLVSGVQVVLLELAHLVLGVAVPLIQRPKSEQHLLLTLHRIFHSPHAPAHLLHADFALSFYYFTTLKSSRLKLIYDGQYR